jgi:hypothetical protein
MKGFSVLGSRFSARVAHFPLPVSRFILSFFTFHFSLFIAFGQGIPAGTLKYPWAGGLNSCQFGSVDLNLDGINDLVIFDRHGNRVIPFINNGIQGLDGYSWHPEYTSLLPDLHDWVILTDYNNDGKQDIFTYSLGGIRVFRNISDTILKFELVTNLLKSFYYNGYVGILVTPVDYPAIADIDGDGDPDILTFFGLGSYIEFHKNLSVEKYGNADSLDYRLTDHCWGNLKESEGSNQLTLNVVCPYKYSGIPGLSCSEGGPKHTGSTLWATDLNNDGVSDLVLGDVDFPNLISVINGGTKDSANMVSQDTAFPSGTRPVRLFSFPAVSNLDINNDGKKELIVSPFDPAYYISDNFRSVWYYENDGTNSLPAFRYADDRFIIHDMIDVGTAACPFIYDMTGDGVPDLVIGNYGYYDSSYYQQGYLRSVFTSKIALYRNTGTITNPSFEFMTDDFAELSSLKKIGLFPAFGDVDDDGDADMIVGNSDGKIIYFQNNAGPGNTPVYGVPVYDYQGIDVGDFSAPQLYDLDGDGRLDLVIGEQKGNLNFYNNTGSASNPVFTLITDSLGKINVTNPVLSYDGFSTPFFFKDLTGNTGLLVGSEEGKVYCFTNIDNNLSGKFSESDSVLKELTGSEIPVNPGWRTSASIFQLSGKYYMDMIVGNFSGGLNYISHYDVPEVISTAGATRQSYNGEVRIFPNPADKTVTLEIFPPPGQGYTKYQIINVLGNVVYEGDCAGRTRIDISVLPAGIYIVSTGGYVCKMMVLH